MAAAAAFQRGPMIRTTPPPVDIEMMTTTATTVLMMMMMIENVFLPFSWIESTFVDGFVGEPARQLSR